MKVEIECEGLTDFEVLQAVNDGIRSRVFMKFRKSKGITGRQMTDEEHMELRPQLETIKVIGVA